MYNKKITNNTTGINAETNENNRNMKVEQISIDQIERDKLYSRIPNDKIKKQIQKHIDTYSKLNDEFAIWVRPIGEKGEKDKKYEIIDGHTRFTVSKEKNLKEIPAIVVSLNDEEACWTQISKNVQNPMKQFEIGCRLYRHDSKEKGGRGKKGKRKELASLIGKSTSYLSQAFNAAKVIFENGYIVENGETIESTQQFRTKAQQLYHISKSKIDKKKDLIDLMLEEKWTAKQTADIVKELNVQKSDQIPSQSDIQKISHKIRSNVVDNPSSNIDSIKRELERLDLSDKPTMDKFKSSFLSILPSLFKNEKSDDTFQKELNQFLHKFQPSEQPHLMN